MERPRCIPGEMRPISGGHILVNTPLVKMVFDQSQKCWPPKKYSTVAAFKSVVDLLRKIASSNISEIEIGTVAVMLYERAAYVRNWRRSRGLIPGDAPAPVRELRRLKKIALKGNEEKTFEALTTASQFVRDLLTDICGDVVYPFAAATSQDVLVEAIEGLLADPKIKSRPREFELDRCASALIAVHERFTGQPARLANDPMSGRPTSELHRFACHIGQILEIPIVTMASDDRLNKMIKDRSEFGHGEMLLLA